MFFVLSIEWLSLLLILASGLFICIAAGHQLNWLGQRQSSQIALYGIKKQHCFTGWQQNLRLLAQITVLVLLSRFIIYLVAYMAFSAINENGGETYAIKTALRQIFYSRRRGPHDQRRGRRPARR